MNGKKMLIAALIAAPLFVAQAAHAQASFDLRIGTPPRRLASSWRRAPRPGYVWAPGYWNWNGRRHVWVDGRYYRNRPHMHYVGPEWRPDGGAYGLRRGGWVRD